MKEVKRIQKKGRNQILLFPDDVIVYVKHPNDSIRKLIQIINTLSEVAGYKINKYISSLLTNDRHAEKGIRQRLLFTIALTILGIYPPKLKTCLIKTLRNETMALVVHTINPSTKEAEKGGSL